MSDIITSQVFSDGERGVTANKMNSIISGSTIQPAFYTSKPVGSTADPADVALILKAGAYTQVPVSTLASSTSVAQIWSTRLRSFNALGNPNFEVDQRSCGTAITITAVGNIIPVDHWYVQDTGGISVSAQQVAASPPIVVPGTSFAISQDFLRITLKTRQTSLAASDYLVVSQWVEGPKLRELISDVHSVSVLVRSSVTGAFSMCLQDPAGVRSLSKLCTIATANAWTLFPLPNLPVWPAGGSFPLTPGSVGYILNLTLAAGTTFTAPALDVWQASGGFMAGPGTSNWAGSANNSTFDVAFVQHEPGGVCSTLMDQPFSQNLDECQRYFSKTYSYTSKPGSVDTNGGNATFWVDSATAANGYAPFKKTMAKIPAVTLYNPNTGVAGSAYNVLSGANSTGLSAGFIGDSAFAYLAGSGLTGGAHLSVHYTADTGM